MAKKISLYALLTVLCFALGYLESLLPLTFIAPGIKLGLANTVTLLLAAKGRVKGAFAVNIARILLSAFLFSSPFSLLFSLSGGVLSLAAVALLFKTGRFSMIGCAIAGALVHNLVQLTAASLLFGKGVWFYVPFLLLSALLTGGAIGTIGTLIHKKVNISII